MLVQPGGLSQDVALGSWEDLASSSFTFCFPTRSREKQASCTGDSSKGWVSFSKAVFRAQTTSQGHPPSAAPRGASEAVRGGFEADLGGGHCPTTRWRGCGALDRMAGVLRTCLWRKGMDKA